MSDLHAWTDGTDTFVATSMDDARRMQREYGGENCDQEDDSAWHIYDPERALTIYLDDGRGKVTKTISEWILEHGPGPLCSTDG